MQTMNLSTRKILLNFVNGTISHRSFNFSLCQRRSAQVSSTEEPCPLANSPMEIEYVKETKLLKIAMIGLPNAGKSTLINQLVGRRVCPMSCKAHTTKIAAKCVQNEGLTQLVYLDTPGLVTDEEFERFKFNEEMRRGVHRSLMQADVIGVMHDAYKKYTNPYFDPVIVELFQTFKAKEFFLILNKIDLVKRKRNLLLMAKALNNSNQDPAKTRSKGKNVSVSLPYFKEIFYVSAATGDGVGDIKAYLLMKARPARWIFAPDVATNTPLQRLIVETLHAACLDNLPQEIPRLLNIKITHLETAEDGTNFASLTITAAKSRHAKLIVGPRGLVIRKIVMIAETNLTSALKAPVYMKVLVDTPSD